MNRMYKFTGNMLDTLTKATLGLLIACMAVMLVQHGIEAGTTGKSSGNSEEALRKLYQQRMERDKKIYQGVETLFEKKQYAAAMDKLKEIRSMYPDNPLSLLYQARLQYNLGMLVESVASYRLAIDAEPDYIDRKSPLFAGKRIKRHVEEAKEKLRRELRLKPNEAKIRQTLDELLYLQRRIAGGCE